MPVPGLRTRTREDAHAPIPPLAEPLAADGCQNHGPRGDCAFLRIPKYIRQLLEQVNISQLKNYRLKVASLLQVIASQKYEENVAREVPSRPISLITGEFIPHET